MNNQSISKTRQGEIPKIPAKVVLSVVASGIMSFCGVVVETAMNITFPDLMKEFSISTSTVQWITSGYLLMLAIIMPTSSFLNRKFTLRQLFITAASTFIAGTLLCAFTPGFSLMLAGRLLQGVGTGIALPLMYNIVLTQVHPARRGTMMGVASLIPAAAPAVGPSLGGLIVKYFGWRMIFITLTPVLILALILGLICIHNNPKEEKSAGSFDFFGWILLAAGFTCLVMMLGNLGSSSFLSAGVLGLLICFVLAMMLFILRSRQQMRRESAGESVSPVISLEVFHSRRFDCALLAFVLMQFNCLGIGFILPNFSQIALGKDALVAGCILLPGCAFAAVFAPISGRIYDHFGARLPLLTGAFCMFASVLLFNLLFHGHPTVLIMMFTYIVFAFGQTNSVGNGMSNGMSALRPELSADGNAVFNTMQQLFGALGTSVVSIIVARHQAAQGLSRGIQTGSRSAFLFMLILAVVLVIAMFGALPNAASRVTKSARQEA